MRVNSLWFAGNCQYSDRDSHRPNFVSGIVTGDVYGDPRLTAMKGLTTIRNDTSVAIKTHYPALQSYEGEFVHLNVKGKRFDRWEWYCNEQFWLGDSPVAMTAIACTPSSSCLYARFHDSVHFLNFLSILETPHCIADASNKLKSRILSNSLQALEIACGRCPIKHGQLLAQQWENSTYRHTYGHMAWESKEVSAFSTHLSVWVPFL